MDKMSFNLEKRWTKCQVGLIFVVSKISKKHFNSNQLGCESFSKHLESWDPNSLNYMTPREEHHDFTS
jgi:hypothetical protein